MMDEMARQDSSPRLPARAGFVVLGLMVAGHTVLETARDALFLSRLPPSRLPLLYLGMAALVFFLAHDPGRLLRRTGRRTVLVAALALSALVTAGSWALLGTPSDLEVYALYVWTGLFSALVIVQLWLLLGEHFTITEARRAYGPIAAGSLVGAVTGALLARAAVELVSNRSLLLLAATLFAAAAMAAHLLLPAARRGAAQAAGGPAAPRPRALGLLWRLGSVLRAGYVRQLALLTGFAAAAGTSADFIFKSTLVEAVPASGLGAAFATAAFVQGALALLVQLFLTGPLLRRAGVTRTLLVLPAAVALGAVGVVAGGGLLAAFALKASDAALRPSLQRTGMELLYLPMEDAHRSELKPMLDTVGQRVGQALAALVLLLVTTVWLGPRVISALLLLLAAGWVAVALALHEGYLELFRRMLRRGRLVPREPGSPGLDLDAFEELLASLNSLEDPVVLTALDMLATNGHARAIPSLILFHPSRDVVLRAFELLAATPRRGDLPIFKRLLAHADAEVRAAALRALAARTDAEVELEAALQDPSPLVRATARVVLAPRRFRSAEPVRAFLFSEGIEEPPAAIALARAIRALPDPGFSDLLCTLARHPVLEVRHEAALALSERPAPEAIDALVAMLGTTGLRAAARKALLTQGEVAREALSGVLMDARSPREVRRAAPAVLARFPPTVPLGHVLLSAVESAPDGLVRFRALRALGQVRTRAPELPLETPVLERLLGRTVEAALQYRHQHQRLLVGLAQWCGCRPDNALAPGGRLLATLLAEKARLAGERAFRLLALLHPEEDVRGIYQGLAHAAPRVRAGSRELLEALTRPPLRGALLSLALPDAADEPELQAQVAHYRGVVSTGDHPELVEALLTSRSAAVKSLAAYHAAELGLQRLRPRLEALRDGDPGRELHQVVTSALRMLDHPSEPASDLASPRGQGAGHGR